MDATQQMIAMLNESFPDLTTMTPLEARAAVDARIVPAPNLGDVASTEDHRVTVAGGDVPVRIYRPRDIRPLAPVVVYAHGGGFVHGAIEGHDSFCRRLALGTGSTVVSVGYRLAPEHPAPTAALDLLSAIDWVAGRAWRNDGIIVAGDSSGANLAAVACLLARDRGDSPLRGQVLLYPILDPLMESRSQHHLADGYFLTSRSIRFYWEAYLGHPVEEFDGDWRVNPLLAGRHDGLPPTIVVTAGLDPLADEGRAYATLLAAAGVSMLHRQYAGEFHGFLTISNFAPADAARAILFGDLTAVFAKESS